MTAHTLTGVHTVTAGTLAALKRVNGRGKVQGEALVNIGNVGKCREMFFVNIHHGEWNPETCYYDLVARVPNTGDFVRVLGELWEVTGVILNTGSRKDLEVCAADILVVPWVRR